MYFTIIETKAVFNELSFNLINFVKENNFSLLASENRVEISDDGKVITGYTEGTQEVPSEPITRDITIEEKNLTVDAIREFLYSKKVDKLVSESVLKHNMEQVNEAESLMEQAIVLRGQIQVEYPYYEEEGEE
jgi:hypothetical protein